MAIATAHPGVTLRPATVQDVGLILGFVRQLAQYERSLHAVEATEELLADSLFGERPCAEAVIALVDQEPAGFAVFFHNFSTWQGRRGLYLEDLYVRAEYRGRGVGQALMRHLAALAVERGCGRFEWSVLDWNQPAIDFYRRIGAVGMDEWTVQRLSGNALSRLAGSLGPDDDT